MLLKCPECDSNEVLVGNKENPHHCVDCEHEWEPCEHEDNEESESIEQKLQKAFFDSK